jgi:DNA repair exonuclease SbcCD nuclease subunit
MITDIVVYLVLSDVHLGHNRTSTSEIIKSLNLFFSNLTSASKFKDLDILIIAGDLFDTLLDFSNGDIHEITIWLGRLINFCSRHNIKLRILEGTPSHDWKQSKISETLVMMMDKPIDFKYIDTIYIEHMDDLGIDILYVPDEATVTTAITLNVVKTIMSELNLDKVDISIMHGMFGHQCGWINQQNGKNHSHVHDADEYLNLTRYFINIGHIHKFSVYERIIAQGSFDRLTHGEEEPKGAVMCSVFKNGESVFNFIENTTAKKYITVILRGYDTDRALKQIEKALLSVPENSYIRIKAPIDHNVYVGIEDIKLRYPMYHISRTSSDKEDIPQQQLNTTIMTSDSYNIVTITQDNIVDLLLTEVQTKHTLTPMQLAVMTSLLKTNL